jgi:hypothetical protein
MAMTYETAKLRTACEADQDILNKLTIVRTDAPTYGKPGPTALNAQARHAHITDKIGVAWVYAGSPLGTDQHILALGKKNNKAKPGNSEYDWSKFGSV